MKLGDIEVNPTGIIAALYIIWGYIALCVLMTILAIVKAIALHFFDYQLTIFGIPL
jgi:hypothetical protein